MEKSKYSLHYYPDKWILCVNDASGSVVKEYEARDVDDDEIKNGTPRYEKPLPGTYIIQVISPIETKSWKFSTIPWGTTVRINPNKMTVQKISGGEILFIGNGYNIYSLLEAYGDMSEKIDAIHNGEEFTAPYRFNDFGRIGIKFFKDINGDGIYTEGIDEMRPTYIHTTPKDEWNVLNKKPRAPLTFSHGCIRMYPDDLKELISNYIIRRVTTITIY